VPDNRGTLITWSAGVSTVAATFAALLATRATTPLSQNLWFIVCLVVAVLSFAVLLLVGLPLLTPWWRSRRRPTLPSPGGDAVVTLFQASCEGAQRRQRELLGTEAEPFEVEAVFALLGSSSDGTGTRSAAPLGSTNGSLGLKELASAMVREPTRLVIRGGDGSGKTVAATLLVLRMLKLLPSPEKLARCRIPVLVSVAGWVAGERFEEWLTERLGTEYSISRSIAANLIRKHQVLPILDGLDELSHDASGPNGGIAFLQALSTWRYFDEPPLFVITCRTDCDLKLEREIQRLRMTMQVQIQPLELDQISAYVNDRLAARQVLAEWGEVLGRIGSPAWAFIGRVLAAPWRLYLAVTLSQAEPQRWPAALVVQFGEEPSAAERRINDDLLSGYVSAIVKLAPWLGEFDVPTVKDERRVEKDEQRAAKVQRWLGTLATLLAQQAAIADANDHSPEIKFMNGTDLVPHLLWPAAGMYKVRAMHAIIGLATLVVAFFVMFAVLGGPGSLAAPAGNARTQESILDTTVQITLIISVLAVTAWLGWGYRWARPHIGTQPHAQLRPRALVGWLWHAVQSRPYDHGFFYGAQVVVSMIGGHSLTEARTIVQRRQNRARWRAGAGMGSPMDALRAYPKYILSFFFITAAFMSLAVMVSGLAVIGFGHLTAAHSFPIAALVIEFLKVWAYLEVLGLAIGAVWLSATPWARYMVGAALAACRRRSKLPPRLGRFLDWACRAGLLRRAGATYQFRHRELQEWLLRDK